MGFSQKLVRKANSKGYTEIGKDKGKKKLVFFVNELSRNVVFLDDMIWLHSGLESCAHLLSFYGGHARSKP